MNKTKVIVTVGPACRTQEQIAALIAEGADVFRLNFSHGTREDHAQAIHAIRAAAGAAGASVAILGDLGGPKIRLTDVDGGAFEIRPDQLVTVRAGACPSTPDCLCTNYDGLAEDVQIGHRVLIDDGQIRLRVVDKAGGSLACRCEAGGVVASRKGINLPDTRLSLPSLTDKDRADLAFAVEHELDYIALSFVRCPEDLHQLRGEIKRLGREIRVVAKIERPEAIEHLDEIIEISDAVMVARGDLGVEMDVSRVPLIQKEITHRCARVGRPVIVATQMLQSMVEAPVPTRAEVSDIANAILDGADAVMLSAETSVGKNPVQALRVIRSIAAQTEAFLAGRPEDAIPRVSPASLRFASAIVHGAACIARELNVRLMAAWTESGATARLLSKRRPPQWIVGLTSDERVCRWMALYYGVFPVRLPRSDPVRQMTRDVDRVLLERGLAAPGDMIVILTGAHLRQPGATNALLIHLVGPA